MNTDVKIMSLINHVDEINKAIAETQTMIADTEERFLKKRYKEHVMIENLINDLKNQIDKLRVEKIITINLISEFI